MILYLVLEFMFSSLFMHFSRFFRFVFPFCDLFLPFCDLFSRVFVYLQQILETGMQPPFFVRSSLCSPPFLILLELPFSRRQLLFVLFDAFFRVFFVHFN